MLNRSFTKRVQKAYQHHVIPPVQHIFINWETYSFHLYDEDGKVLLYQPTPTGLKFHQTNDFVRGIIGPYGSGKTTAMLADIVFRSCQMPIGSGNKRYSRWAIIRNTYAELESTTYVSWCSWFSNLGVVHRNKKPLLTMRHAFNDENGSVELEILFIALDSESDIRKLKSLEVCGVYMNEASEIPYAIFEHAGGRVGRYMMNHFTDYWKGIILDTNPPSTRHWIYKTFEEDSIKSHILFHQPPGLIKDENDNYIPNREADNFERLKEDYYIKYSLGKTQEFINVYCLGKYGTLINAKKVYEEYNDDVHSVELININKDLPLYIGMDFGLTPAAIFIQQTLEGIYNVIYELTTERMGTEQFIDNVLNPFISRYCQDVIIEEIIGDPAGEKANENDLTSCFDRLRNAGYFIRGASTNFITPRIDAVKEVLGQMIDGHPRIIVSRRTCQKLREGFLGGYCYKEIKVNGTVMHDKKPYKNEFSHVHDALQYVILYLNGQYIKKDIPNVKPRIMSF